MWHVYPRGYNPPVPWWVWVLIVVLFALVAGMDSLLAMVWR